MARGSHMNDFTVETNNQCFICFEKVRYGSSSVKLGSHFVHSLQYLSRYLKMDMRKVFHEEESIPPHLLAQVQSSKLKVELCEDCGRMNETFSKQYKQLEKIEMEVISSLKLIHGKAMEANKTAHFQNLNADDFNGKMDIANSLRSEAIGKCKRKLGRHFPLIRIQKLSMRKFLANKLKNRPTFVNSFRKPSPKDSLSLDDNLTDVKVEVLLPQSDPNDMYENDYFDDSHPSNLHNSGVDLDDTACETKDLAELTTLKSKLNGAMQRMVVRGSVGGSPSRMPFGANTIEGERYTIIPDTGKLKCNLCSMEFKNKSGMKYHYEGIHLGIKYKCNLCEKEYSQRPAYNLHHRNSHKGLPYSFSVVTASEQEIRETVGSHFNSDTGRRQCDLCSCEFESADDLQSHYSSAHPDIKYRCKLCFQEFGQFSSYQQHQCNEPRS